MQSRNRWNHRLSGLMKDLLALLSGPMSFGDSQRKFQLYGNTLGSLVNDRYQRYAESCKSQTSMVINESGVRSQGAAMVRGVIPEQDALQLSTKIDHVSAVLTTDLRANCVVQPLVRPIATLGRRITDIFYNESLDEQIRQFFGSHYRIQGVESLRVLPGAEPDDHHGWHWNNVPCETLQVMLFLNSLPCDAVPQFLNLRDARAFYTRGFTGRRRQHAVDLQAFAKDRDLRYSPFSLHPGAGDVLLLQNTLYRSIPSKTQSQDVVSYLLLPNPVAWDEQLAIDSMSELDRGPCVYPRVPWHAKAA